MKAMFAGFIAMTLIAIGAHYALLEAGFSSQERNAGANVRLD